MALLAGAIPAARRAAAQQAPGLAIQKGPFVGPGSKVKGSAHFNENGRKDLTAEDVRFTTRGKTLYAFLMGWPGKQAVVAPLASKGARSRSEGRDARREAQRARGHAESGTGVGLAGSKNQASYATENRSLTFRAGRARPLHRIVVGARHASPGTLESGGTAPSRSVFHGVSRAEGPSQQATRNDGPPHKIVAGYEGLRVQ